MIALNAVVAREIALQRGEDSHAQLVLSGPELGEEILDVLVVGGAALDDEAVLGKGGKCFALAHIRHEAVAAQTV